MENTQNHAYIVEEPSLLTTKEYQGLIGKKVMCSVKGSEEDPKEYLLIWAEVGPGTEIAPGDSIEFLVIEDKTGKTIALNLSEVEILSEVKENSKPEAYSTLYLKQ